MAPAAGGSHLDWRELRHWRIHSRDINPLRKGAMKNKIASPPCGLKALIPAALLALSVSGAQAALSFADSATDAGSSYGSTESIFGAALTASLNGASNTFFLEDLAPRPELVEYQTDGLRLYQRIDRTGPASDGKHQRIDAHFWLVRGGRYASTRPGRTQRTIQCVHVFVRQSVPWRIDKQCSDADRVRQPVRVTQWVYGT